LPIKQVVAKHFKLDTRDDVETIDRGDVVDLIIEHPSDGTFLLLRETNGNNPDVVHFVGGGTEGENHEFAIKRELGEETGFVNYEVVAGPIDIATCIAYRHTKNKNQITKSFFYYLKLKDLKQVSSEIDEGRHTIEWRRKEEIAQLITWEGHTHGWNSFLQGQNYTDKGMLVNSSEFDGVNSEEAKVKIVEKVGGRMTKTYKLKDWVFSRQRYWGEPFPIIHGEDGKIYPVAFEQLPVTLPEVEHYEPAGDGQSPLANIPDWVNVTGYLNEDEDFVVADKAPEGKTLLKGKRETNTMPQWAGSSWYYLRFIDPTNQNALIDPEKEKRWQPVDVYVGGDHAVRHLIYARFWHKFLYDIGVVSTIEPFQRLEFLGFILAEDGRKMSKRWGNVINPDDIVKLVGADTMRVYEMFMGPFENTIAWSQDGLVGARRFLERTYGLSEHITENETQETTTLLHKTIKKVGEDIESFKFNTAVSTLMIYLNGAEKAGLTHNSYLTFLKLLAPFAPHLAEELWSAAKGLNSIHSQEWPQFDQELTIDKEITLGVQINGKMRGTIDIAPDASEEAALEAVGADNKLNAKMSVGAIKKVIYIPGKILNIILEETSS